MIGGTWSFYPKKYQTNFIKNCFDACNQTKSVNLKQAQHKNEKTKHRIVGLSIETRPDFIDEKEIKRMRSLGITRVELGIQSIYNDVLKINKRGHKIESAIKATKLLKDAGFKVSYQMMLNLPGSDIKKDLEMFKQLFHNSDFQPDLLKIYPTALLKEAPLYKWWLKERYQPYISEQLVSLIKSIKKYIPYYVRIERIIRDIPSTSIVAGPIKISNLRQSIAKEIEKDGWHCHCIRCREIGKDYDKNEKLKLFREDYDASQGKEIFLSFEDKKRNKIYSLLRLRIAPIEKHFLPVLNNTAIIREIHTYGQQLALGQEKMPNLSVQHKGLGKKLILEAEKITQTEFNLKKIAVISGIGAREYFKKLGYKLQDEYMIKNL
ncbi:MAG: tRNA uridine(34) 5-carboxymethylaminomethyl modification radical SAM/GNAT enzyme Elp3 [Patescibacteria group bacterium]